MSDEKKRKYGHVIGLNLSRNNQDGPPITIDGVPFSAVADIAVVAAPNKGINVIVTFHASHLGGVESNAMKEHLSNEQDPEQ